MSCLDKTNANFMRVLENEARTENYVLIAALAKDLTLQPFLSFRI
jgi:hypothetical protein